jgi:hypothetical protein
MSVKLRKNSAIADDKIAKMIEGQIKALLRTKHFAPRAIFIRRMEYFPVYGACEYSGEKTITKFYCKSSLVKEFKPITVSEIEIAGVTIMEFVDYILRHGAKEVTIPVEKMLEYV